MDESRSQQLTPPGGSPIHEPQSPPAAESGVSGASEQSHLISPPAISIPKGGGAIRGIGEKFSANPVTGTGSMTVPIAVSPGRSGFGPQLSLAYDSGSGNGPFGFGWNLSLPSITRKTDKGLPRYLDAEDSDEFLLSGAEDLVPVFKKDEPPDLDPYVVRRYRPRVEGLFARIERWTHKGTGDVHWRSITRDNVTTVYGWEKESRIQDPLDPDQEHSSRIFSWLISASWDDKGNAILYRYKPEDAVGVDRAQAHERNRSEESRSANRYLKRIFYGNRTPNRDSETWRATGPDQLSDAEWLFEVVFDYGEERYEEAPLDPDLAEESQHRYVDASATLDPDRTWPIRPDPFSSYRAGFEVRTYRRCRRVLMFHRFPELRATEPSDENAATALPCLVRSTELHYADLGEAGPDPVPVETELAHRGSTRFASFIQAVTQSGYVHQSGDRYLRKSLPPLELGYSKPLIHEAVHDVDPASLEGLPAGLADPSYRWVDLDGEGVSGILAEQGGGLYYLPNWGDGRLGPPRSVARKPPVTALTEGGQQLLDLAGDGQLDLVELDGPTPGFYERTPDRNWISYRPFARLPNIPWDDPNLRFVDLNGDGHADVLISEDEAFTWYGSLAEAGFGPARHARKPLDEEQGPRVVFADGTQSIYLADMCGDGLADLVRIRNGEVCYWPSLGYGRFGRKVTMDHAPLFDRAEQFDQRRIRLADIDGSGTSDILYLGGDGVRLYFNQSGNHWSRPHRLAGFPPVDDLSAVAALDLLGSGTACLVWSSPLPEHGRRPMRYIDLMGGRKPHLLVRSANNLGAETHVHYTPSTRFYLADEAAGRPWITRLPFPVQVVERVETYDCISRNRFTTRYAYHHGHFEGMDREFRGFGMVEQWDTEELSALAGDDDSAETMASAGVPSCHAAWPPATNLDRAYQVPPVHTKTWFHTGVYLGHQHVSDFFAGLLDGRDRGEYYREPGLDDDQARALLLPDTHLPSGLSAEEAREACRTLKGSVLRQEIYALDDPDEGPARPYRFSEHPYRVSERNYDVKRVQPRGQNRHAVFFAHPRETLDLHYERKLTRLADGRWAADPRMSHGMTLEVDDYGNVLRSAAIAYPRRTLPGVAVELEQTGEQTETHVALTVNRVANCPGVEACPQDEERPDRDDWYRIGVPVEARTFELVNPLAPERETHLVLPFDFEDMQETVDGLLAPERDPPTLHPSEDWDWRSASPPPAEGRPRLRPIEHVRAYYRSDDLSRRLELGQVESLALPYESYQLAFTAELLEQVYKRDGEDLLPAEPGDVLAGGGPDRGGYTNLDGDGRWWIPSGRVFYSPDDAAAERAHARQHFFLPGRYRDPFHRAPEPPNAAGWSTETRVEYDAYDLLVVEIRDALDNVVTVRTADDAGETDVRIDYRLLQPYWITDPNGNRTQVASDALGMVVGTAVMGKPPPGPREGDSVDGFEADLTEAEILDHLANPLADPHAILGRATTRLVYDLFAYRRTRDQAQPQLAVVCSLARETHDSDLVGGRLTKVQHGFSYSDGFGREIQKKIQAETGPVPRRDASGRIMIGTDDQPLMTEEAVAPRWVGSGWTVFNNKGKPVRQYEPFFTDSHCFERDVRIGVSPVLFYDPLGRVVATLHPNRTWEKVVFDPWRQETWDANDTIAKRDENGAAQAVDPKADEHVGDFFRRLPEADYWPTWHALRTDPAYAETFAARYADEAMRGNETAAARKSEIHAATPAAAHADTLGRSFLTIAHNRFELSDVVEGDAPTEERYRIRVVFDIEGNQREVIDAKGRIVMRYAYDMLGNRIYQISMEAGERWMLNDLTGNPIRAWDSRRHAFSTEYDELRRATHQYLRYGDDKRVLLSRILYGEHHADSDEGTGEHRLNLRGQIYLHFDQAGVAINERFDFKGNLLANTRRLARNYKPEKVESS